MSERWTSDLLLTEQGIKAYAAQIREIFREHATEFRALAGEVRDDLVADPIEGDNFLTSRVHAWQVSKPLRDMARHAQAIVAAAKALEGGHRRIVLELPKARAAKTAAKELGKTGRALPAGAVNRTTAAATAGASLAATGETAADPQSTPFLGLFDDMREAR